MSEDRRYDAEADEDGEGGDEKLGVIGNPAVNHRERWQGRDNVATYEEH